MVAIVTGKGTGLERSSAYVLGSQGQIGSSLLGRDGENVYVNAANGNLVITRQDEFLIGLGTDISINRTYNSQATADGDNNDNWQSGAYRKVYNLVGSYGGTGSTVTRMDWDGSQTVYAWSSTFSAYVSTDGAGAYDKLTRSGDIWTWTDGTTQRTELYDQTIGGVITQAGDTDGNLDIFRFDVPSQKITRVTSRNVVGGVAHEEYVDLFYNGSSQLIQLVTQKQDGTIARVVYSYDGYSRLSTMRIDLSPADGSVDNGYKYVTTYTYDGTSKRVASIAQSDGSMVQITYDGSARVSSFAQTVETGVIRTTSFDYQATGRTIVTDPAGLKTTLNYDGNGNLTSIGYPPENGNTAPRTVQFLYTETGDIKSVVQGAGNVINYTYDNRGNRILERDSAGNTVERTYSDKNELRRETRYPTASTPVTSRYAYDEESHLRFEVSAEGYVTEHRYDAEGRRIATITYAGTLYDVSSLAADALVDRTALETWVTNLTTKANAVRTERGYDYRGNLTRLTSYETLQADGTFLTSSSKSETLYVYDEWGNLLQRTVSNPQTPGTTLTENFIYDGLNRMTVATDFSANVTRTTFLDNRSQTVVTHANGLSEISTYNLAGERIAFSTSNAGGNLIDLSGWPGDSASLPSGNATVSGWWNPGGFVDETQWATTTGPDGLPVAAIRAGQTDTSQEGGGNYTNVFSIDASKAYEFTYYFKLSDLNKHAVYFGLDSTGGLAVENAATGADDTNPYFFATGLTGQEATYTTDTWYKVVGYVLAEGSTAPASPIGGVYNMATGEKVAAVSTFRWNPERMSNQVNSRFFDFYGEANQQYSTYFYKPEVRQVTIPVTTGANLVDMAGWPGNASSPPSGNATVPGWINNAWYNDETMWTATTGPDAQRVVAMRAGQTDSGPEGGGNYTNYTTIDATKAYEFTYYFKFSDLNKHAIYFGLNTGAAWVENAATGADETNPYFFSSWLSGQEATFAADTWYKVVGYVLPQGAAAPATPMGGVYNVDTGQKVAGVNTFRWNAERPDNQVYSRFFNFYGEANQQYSTYFYQPEIRQVIPTAPLASDTQTSLYRYDKLGRLRMTVDPTGRRQYMMYDTVGRKVADIDADGSVIEYRYDGNDNLTSTTRYATRLNATQLASLVDNYGNPTNAAFSTLRPGANADDRWTFNIYDSAQRLVQTIDGTGATSVFTYDGASHLVSTKTYANRISSSDIVTLKEGENHPNHWADFNGLNWGRYNNNVASTTLDGADAYKFTLTTDATFNYVVGNAAAVAVGDIVTYSISLRDGGTGTSQMFGLYGTVDYWGSAENADGAIISGPGSLVKWSGALWILDGLSSTETTQITVSRRYTNADTAAIFFYVGGSNWPGDHAGDAIIMANPSWQQRPSAPVFVPTADLAKDRVTRNFYDKDGRLTGTLDAEGYVSKIVYDKAGRQIETIGYSNITTTDRVSGTLDQLIAGAGADNSKDIHNWFVYDGRGLLRATVDGEGSLTRTNYNALGDISQVITGEKLNPATLIGTPPTLASIGSPSGILQTVNYTRNAFGDVTREERSLTGSTTTFTDYSYDNVRRLVKTITQSGGTDPRTSTERYDLRGNVIATLSGIGNATLPANPTQAQIDAAYSAYGTTFIYDKADRLLSSTDPNGNRTLFYYDADGRLVYQIEAVGNPLNPYGQVTEYQYNGLGDRISAKLYGNPISSAILPGMTGGNVTTAVAAIVNGVGDARFDRVSLTAYDVDGTVKQLTDPLGTVTTFTYNTSGQQISEVDASGTGIARTTALSYDRRGLLKTQVVDSVSGHKQITTIYGYDAFGRAMTLTNALGRVTTFIYDRAGQLTGESISPDGGATVYTTTYIYNARGNRVAVTDANGKVTRHVFDKGGREIATIDALGEVVATTYDADGRVVATRAYANTISLAGLPLEVTESSLSLPATNAADHVTRFAYDKDGRLRFTIDGLMHVVENVYDDNGNVIRTVAYDGTISTPANYLEATLVAAVSSLASAPGTRVTRAVYDASNRQIYGIDALGQVTVVTYNSVGQVVKQVQVNARYTGSGDPSLSAMDTWLSINGNAANDRTTRAYYDLDGQLNYSIDAMGFVTRTQYDKLGNVTSQSRYLDAYSATDATILETLNTFYTSPPATTRVTQFGYDTAGRLVQTIDPEGYVTALTLDAMGQVLTSTAASGTGDASTTAYTYDDVGRVVKQVRASGVTPSASWFYYDALGRQTATVDPGNYLSVLTYDAAGNLLTETHYAHAITGSFSTGSTVAALQALAGTSANDTSASTGYDAFGRVTTATDARGSVVSNGYDVIDRLLTQNQQMESGTGDDRITTYTYDNFGDVVKVHDARGNDTFSYYDKLSRLLRQVDAEHYVTDTTYTRGSQVATVKRWANRLEGGVSETSFPANPTADATRDATTSFTFNKRDELVSATDAMSYTEYYDLNGFGERTAFRNKLWSVSNNTTVSYTYDKRGLLLTETLPVTTKTSGGATIAVQNTYLYDGRGNRTRMTEAAGAAEARTTNYIYDKLDQVTATTHDAVTVTNTDLTTSTNVPVGETAYYDSRGNVIKTVDTGGAQKLFYYDHLSRLIAEIDQCEVNGFSGPIGQLTTFTYDKNGNRTSAKAYETPVSLPGSPGGSPPPGSGAARETSYTYDRSNRLLTTTVAGIAFGVFDGTNYVTTYSGDTTTTLVYDMNGNVVKEIDGRGAITWTWYDKLNRKVTQVDGENYFTYWQLDAEGNTVADTRYSSRISGSFDTSTYFGDLFALVAPNSALDRTTTFTYDRNGRRTSERRWYVDASTVSATGALSTSNQTSVIQYTYDGLGNVVTRTEANTDQTTYAYDKIGRLTLETGQSFTDYLGATVAPRTAYAYDGLNNIKSTRLQAAATANDTNDRITSFTYGAGGRLASMTDAAGQVHNYGYDVAGRQVVDSYSRLKSDGTTITEAQVSLYDVAGRVITQTSARFNGSSWVFTSPAGAGYGAVRVQYNAFGEVTGRGLTALPSDAAVFQETYAYDLAGRLWKSNEGDGVLRLFLYDKSGNRTLTLASTGGSLSSLDISGVISSLDASGDTNIANAVTTIAVFDKRGQQTSSREPDRQRTASGTTTIVRSNTYNAFGEVTTETDARGYLTSYTYNTMGRVTSKVSPQISVTAENGATSNLTPTENYYFDISGRLVGVRDANAAMDGANHTTTRQLLAGTGYEKDSEALVLKEFHPDYNGTTGAIVTKYDVFGDARVSINEVGSTTTSDYDKMGRVAVVHHPVRAVGAPGNPDGSGAIQLIDYYAYDGLGQRIQHWNSQFGSSIKERTDYDARGRVIATVGYDSGTFTYAYVWDGTLATGGMATYGAWTTTTTNVAASRSMTQADDYFGHTIDQVDYGGHDYAFTYDLGGRLTARSNNAGESVGYSWYNTGLASGQTGTQGTATYAYDANGNRIAETFVKSSVSYRNAIATYDAMSRMTHWEDTGYAAGAPASSDWEYDAVGNVRYTSSTYRTLDSQGYVSASGTTQSYWYLYDNMNRFTLTKGTFSGSRGSGTIERGSEGTEITYNGDGSRHSALYTATVHYEHWVWHPDGNGGVGGEFEDPGQVGGHDGQAGHWESETNWQSGDRREDYIYTADGYLARTLKAESYSDAGPNPGPTGQPGEILYYGPPETGAVFSQMERDALGRITRLVEGGAFDGWFERSNIIYDYAGHELSEKSTTVRRDNNYALYTTYNTYTDNTYSGGLLTQTVQDTYKDGDKTSSNHVDADNAIADTRQTYTYAWWDGAMQSSIGNDKENNGSIDWTTSFTLDSSGHVSSAYVGDGRPRTVSFVVDQSGQIAARDEDDSTSGGDPRTLRYFFGGQQLGMVTNNGTDNMNYPAAIADRLILLPTSDQGGAFRNGSKTAKPYADFEQSYDAINGYQTDDTASAYTAHEGDTLQSIALAVWGDASLWYLIADANGLTNESQLAQGQTISLPNKIRNNRNSADTFRPYDPNEALGNLSPTSPKPPKKLGACAVVGQIVAAVIAIAVSELIHIPVIGPVIGNLASQAFLVATGIQDKFDWKSVATTAITSTLTLGLSELNGPIGVFANSPRLVNQVVTAMAVNTVTQGISVATGLQKKFDFVGVAAAGVGAAAGHFVGGKLHPTALRGDGLTVSNILANLGTSGAKAFSNAATRTLLSGTSFGDNIIAALPDVIGNTLGEAVSGALAGRSSPTATVSAGSSANGASAAPAAASDIVLNLNAERPHRLLLDGFQFEPLHIEVSPELQAWLDYYAVRGPSPTETVAQPANPIDDDNANNEIVVTGTRSQVQQSSPIVAPRRRATSVASPAVAAVPRRQPPPRYGNFQPGQGGDRDLTAYFLRVPEAGWPGDEVTGVGYAGVAYVKTPEMARAAGVSMGTENRFDDTRLEQLIATVEGMSQFASDNHLAGNFQILLETLRTQYETNQRLRLYDWRAAQSTFDRQVLSGLALLPTLGAAPLAPELLTIGGTTGTLTITTRCVAGAGYGMFTQFLVNEATSGNHSVGGYAGSAAAGCFAAQGISLANTRLATVNRFVDGAAVGVGGELTSEIVNGEEINPGRLFISAVTGGTINSAFRYEPGWGGRARGSQAWDVRLDRVTTRLATGNISNISPIIPFRAGLVPVMQSAPRDLITTIVDDRLKNWLGN